jgi:hypothetical protein
MRASVVVLALCMLLTGSINTIATKYQVGDQRAEGYLATGHLHAQSWEEHLISSMHFDILMTASMVCQIMTGYLSICCALLLYHCRTSLSLAMGLMAHP